MPRLVLLAVLVVVAAGCSHSRPGGKDVTPTPTEIVGAAPKPTTTTAVKGNADAGKPIFTAQGCGGCHTFQAAGANGKVGPDLDKLADYAKTANQGTLEEFTHTSIVDPGAYVEKGYAAGVMPATYGTSLKPQQLADLVAFLVQGN